MSSYYKIFFTIYFDYVESKNKTITRFFKSDLDLGHTDFYENVNDDNISKLWMQYASQKKLNDLNLDKDFNDNTVNNKKVITYRIINLKTLSEVFLKL